MKWIPIQLILAGGLAYFISNDLDQGLQGLYSSFISLALLILGIHVGATSHEMAALVKSYRFLPHHWWWSPLRFHGFTALGLAGVFAGNYLKGVAFYDWIATGLYLVLVACLYSNGRARHALLRSAYDFSARYRTS